MKRTLFFIPLLILTICAVDVLGVDPDGMPAAIEFSDLAYLEFDPVEPSRGSVYASTGSFGGFFDSYIANRLEIGLRVSHFRFDNASRVTQGSGGYAPGISTYDLEEEQSRRVTPYFQYHINPHLALQLGWERLQGATRTINVDTLEPYEHSNGSVKLSGTSLSVLGRYPLPNQSWLTPYMGLGVIRYKGSFAMDEDWHANGRRFMEAENTWGLTAIAGASIRLHEHLYAELSMRFVRARPEGRYRLWIDRDYRAEWEFPMDSWVYDLGLKYRF